jgi:hypothetical protein
MRTIVVVTYRVSDANELRIVNDGRAAGNLWCELLDRKNGGGRHRHNWRCSDGDLLRLVFGWARHCVIGVCVGVC